MAKFAAFLDESGTHEGSEVTVVAGALSRQSSWSSIVGQWCKVLEKYDVPYFHATDVANFRGPYRNWNENTRRGFLETLLKITRKESITLVAHSLWTDLFKRVKQDFPEVPVTAYQICCEWCLALIGNLAMRRNRMPPVAITFESGQNTHSLVLRGTMHWARFEEFRKRAGIGAVTFAEKSAHVELQLADLVAFEFYKQSLLCRPGPVDKLRYPMSKLIENADWPKGGVIQEDSLRNYLSDIESFILAYRKQDRRA